MTAFVIALLATAIGLGISILLIPGIRSKNTITFIIASTVLALINVFIRPVLWFLTAPLSILTFGLFALVINAFMIMLVAALVPNFEVKGFGSAFLGAITMAIIAAISFIAISLITGADISWTSYNYQSQTF